MVFRPAWPAITPPSLYGRLLCPWRKSPQTLTHLDTYCRRVCASDISEADLGTFGRSFVCEVLASLDFSLTSTIGRVHCNLQGMPGFRQHHHHLSCESLPSLCACLDGTEEDRTQPLLPTSVRRNPNGQLNNS